MLIRNARALSNVGKAGLEAIVSPIEIQLAELSNLGKPDADRKSSDK